MARFQRRQPSVSRLRAPTVTGPPVVFRPIQVELAEQQRPSQIFTRRAPHSKLRPPAKIGPPVTFRPVLEQLAPSTRIGRRPHPILFPPAVVGTPNAFRPVFVKYVQQPPRYQHTVYKILPPIKGAPIVFRPVLERLAPSTNLGRRVRRPAFTGLFIAAAAVVPPAADFPFVVFYQLEGFPT